MKITNEKSETAVLRELGRRLVHERLKQQLTQAQLASASGVSKRTIERMESGHSAQFASVIHLLRALSLLEKLDTVIPIADLPPAELFLNGGRQRKRASGRRTNHKDNAGQTTLMTD